MVVNLINGLIIGSSYVLIAAGLTLIFGILDSINLAHGEFYMMGAFVTFFMFTTFGLNFWLALILSMLIVAAFGVLIEKLAFRPLRSQPLLNTMLVSIGLSVLLQNVAQLLWSADPRIIKTSMVEQTIRFAGVTLNLQRLIVIVMAAILMVGLHFLIKKSTIGKAMRSVAQDRDAAALMGVNIDRIFTFTFAIGCALAAAAGGLIGPIFLVFPTMGAVPFIKAFTVVILGGLGNVFGAIVGGLLLGVIESFGAAYISTMYKDTFAFIILILVLLFKPSGLLGRG